MKKILILLLVVTSGCVNKEIVNSNPKARDAASLNGSAAVCYDVMNSSMSRAYNLILASDLLVIKDRQDFNQDVNQFKIVCGGPIPKSVGYQLNREQKLVLVDSDLTGLLQLTDSPYAREKMKQYDLNVNVLNMQRFLTAYGVLIISDELGQFKKDYDVFYKALKKLENQ